MIAFGRVLGFGFRFSVLGTATRLEVTTAHETHNDLIGSESGSIDWEGTNGAGHETLPETAHTLCPPDKLEAIDRALVSRLLGIEVVALDTRLDHINRVGSHCMMKKREGENDSK